MSDTKERRSWLQKQKGIRVFNPDRNDGIYAFKYFVSFTGKEKIGLVKFYEVDGELFWQQTKKKDKKTGKTIRKHDMVSIEPDSVTALADALYKLMDQPVKDKKERLKEMKDKGGLENLADAFDFS